MCTTHISGRRRLLDRPLLRRRIFFSLSLFRKMNFIQTLHEANEMFEFLGIHSDTDRYICIGAGTQIITGITHSIHMHVPKYFTSLLASTNLLTHSFCSG